MSYRTPGPHNKPLPTSFGPTVPLDVALCDVSAMLAAAIPIVNVGFTDAAAAAGAAAGAAAAAVACSKNNAVVAADYDDVAGCGC